MDPQQTTRPLDFLNQFKGKKIDILCKDVKDPIEGILLVFDININLVIELPNKKRRFIRGDTVIFVNEL